MHTNAAFVCMLFLAGCGTAGNHAPIHGEVTLDGKPLSQGSILFTPLEGTQGVVTGTQITDGHYKIDEAKGPAVGRNRVQIQAVRGSGKMVQNPMGPKGELIEMYVGAIPARYNTASELEVDVHSGDNIADFNLQSR